jgi:hypothetical protein
LLFLKKSKNPIIANSLWNQKERHSFSLQFCWQANGLNINNGDLYVTLYCKRMWFIQSVTYSQYFPRRLRNMAPNSQYQSCNVWTADAQWSLLFWLKSRIFGLGRKIGQKNWADKFWGCLVLYVLWYCSGICHQLFPFIQIGSRTVIDKGKYFNSFFKKIHS